MSTSEPERGSSAESTTWTTPLRACRFAKRILAPPTVAEPSGETDVGRISPCMVSICCPLARSPVVTRPLTKWYPRISVRLLLARPSSPVELSFSWRERIFESVRAKIVQGPSPMRAAVRLVAPKASMSSAKPLLTSASTTVSYGGRSTESTTWTMLSPACMPATLTRAPLMLTEPSRATATGRRVPRMVSISRPCSRSAIPACPAAM
mmetsp:Transcript_21404/g.51056  ORF Transcript_21404/g.51056 Transcript_21404/m.51056 type:complete len:208 (-) Transcript_21404:2329-2952(-)